MNACLLHVEMGALVRIEVMDFCVCVHQTSLVYNAPRMWMNVSQRCHVLTTSHVTIHMVDMHVNVYLVSNIPLLINSMCIYWKHTIDILVIFYTYNSSKLIF